MTNEPDHLACKLGIFLMYFVTIYDFTILITNTLLKVMKFF